ncbi:MAG TPA: FKBP-type peptidyl-prolyl cis-trans isomerase [Telluria sp.]|nr:FKBP-type peptidyl-prolyl cis-trans isomerase [Telluria sp.]
MKMKLPLIAAFVALVSLTACGGGGSSSSTPANTLVYSGNPAALTKTDSVLGTGTTAASTSVVTVKYTGWLYNDKAADFKGTQFDTGTLTAVQLGQNKLISGFEQGVVGMKVGGKRIVLIPSSLGYGATGAGSSIPPNAGLVFELELTSVQ